MSELRNSPNENMAGRISGTDSYRFICRRCFFSGFLATTAERVTCPSCDSPDIRANDDIFSLAVAHIDCDSFYASIEKRDNPELLNRPVIVGGQERGVVAAACYVARRYGIKSAMPSFKARQLCPELVIIKPRMAHYSAVSRQIRDKFLQLTPAIEPLSIDEAFLDLTGTERLHKASPAEMLMRLQAEIARDIGITVSVGLSSNKSLAKLASDQDKPNGFFILNPKEAKHWLADKPVSIIYGVGKAAAKRLADAQIVTCQDLINLPRGEAEHLLGKQAAFLQNLAQGIDDRPVKPSRAVKSVSSETTFHHDIADESELVPILERQALRVSRRLKEKQLAGRVVSLKLKSNRHKIITRQVTLGRATDKAFEIFEAAHLLLKKEISASKHWRLLGVGVDGFDEEGAMDFLSSLDDSTLQKEKIETALDHMHAKFGDDLVFSGRQVEKLAKTKKRDKK